MRPASGVALLLALVATLLAPGSALGQSSDLTFSDGVLRWDARGAFPYVTINMRSPETIPPSCGAKPSPCLRVGTQSRTFTSVPAPCTAASEDLPTSSFLCPDAEVRELLAVGDGTGPFQVTTGPGPPNKDYACPATAVTIVQQGSDGGTATRDGCVQTVQCAVAYDGRVDADRIDTVADSCRWLLRDGVEIRREPRPTPQPEPTPTPTPTPAPTPAPVTPEVDSPLSRVQVLALKGRRLSVAVKVKRATRATVTVERRVGKRWVRSASKRITATRAGTVKTTIGVAGARRGKAGRYRVVVTVAGVKHGLVSSALNVR